MERSNVTGNLLIIGAGGHGRVVLEAARAAGWRITGFIDANPSLHGRQIGGATVLGGLPLLRRLVRSGEATAGIVAIGDNRVRREYGREVRDAGLSAATIVHPRAWVAATARPGGNVLIAAGAVVATEAVVGDDAIVNTAAVIEHECAIGPGVHVAPGAVLGGRVTVGAEAFVGLGSRILPCLSVGERATVGAGAVVLHDVPPGVTVVGVPAKPLREMA